MFDFKNGVFTIDTTLSVADTQALNAFADTVRNGERERIIKLLEESDIGRCCFESHDLIALIKGEQNEDACEPSDSPCVNGWSCQKHRMTIEQMTDFIALIKGEK